VDQKNSAGVADAGVHPEVVLRRRAHRRDVSSTGGVRPLGSAPEREVVRAYGVSPVHYLSACTEAVNPEAGPGFDP
jgi:hypothetical protein